MSTTEDLADINARIERMNLGGFAIDMARYTCDAVLTLLQLVKLNVAVDWDEMIGFFLDHLSLDRNLVAGSNSLQELYMWLHVSCLYKSEAFNKELRHFPMESERSIRS